MFFNGEPGCACSLRGVPAGVALTAHLMCLLVAGNATQLHLGCSSGLQPATDKLLNGMGPTTLLCCSGQDGGCHLQAGQEGWQLGVVSGSCVWEVGGHFLPDCCCHCFNKLWRLSGCRKATIKTQLEGGRWFFLVRAPGNRQPWSADAVELVGAATIATTDSPCAHILSLFTLAVQVVCVLQVRAGLTNEVARSRLAILTRHAASGGPMLMLQPCALRMACSFSAMTAKVRPPCRPTPCCLPPALRSSSACWWPSCCGCASTHARTTLRRLTRAARMAHGPQRLRYRQAG